jgi:uncharacterized phage protein (TIGR01671 family)
MKEIKFRAFDKNRKDMYYIDDFYWFEEEGVHNSEGFGHYANYVLMQFTGLKDKNDKEIYEGDIVRYLDELDGKTELFGFVEWERCWWSVNLHPDFLRENDIMDTDEYLTYEVVGNIYENKDMIYWIK